MSQQITTLCFDLDGTLIDTAPDLLAALDHTLQQAGYPLSDHIQIRPIIGRGAKAMLKRAFCSFDDTIPTPDNNELDQLWQSFIEHYSIHIANQSSPFEGVVPTLTELQHQGYLLAICTNKPMFLTEPLLEALELTTYFAAIKGADSFPFKKPDPRHLTETILAAGGQSQAAIMIGDSKTDIETARNAQIPVIGVDFGYTDLPMSALAPDKIMSNYSQLLALTAELSTQKR